MRGAAISVALLIAACSGRAAAPAPAPGPTDDVRRADEPLMSDPAEYDIPRVSRDAGEAIFTRTGIGDPYRTGVPYPVFLALLRAYPETFGGTLDELAAKFGLLARAPDPTSDDLDLREGLPIGLHLTIDPITSVPFVVGNCALCHAERIRWDGGEATVIGLGSKRVRIHAYDAAFGDAAREDDFTLAHLGALAQQAADERGVAWPTEYAQPLVKATLRALEARADERAELHRRTRDGLPGKVAPIEAFAVALAHELGEPVEMAAQVGWAKVPDVIGFGQRVTLSWDAIGEGAMDVLVVEADFAAGVRPDWFWAHPLQGASLGAYLRQPAPRPAFPGAIDRKLAARGKVVFDDACGPCHGSYADDGRVTDYTERVVSVEDLGTDPARAYAATSSFVRAANDPELTRGVTRVKPTGGYVPPVLSNVWARAPYGHAGQWTSLRVIATDPAARATAFVVQLDAPYDLANVGVATRTPGGALAAGEYLHDATQPGLSVGGHPFLATLGDDISAVIEYLKTL